RRRPRVPGSRRGVARVRRGALARRRTRDRSPRVTAHELFVPGRLCIVGEHSDWAGEMRADHPALAKGYCLVTTTEQGLRATAARAGAFEITTPRPDGGEERFACTPAALA